jgi:hypothetical protein
VPVSGPSPDASAVKVVWRWSARVVAPMAKPPWQRPGRMDVPGMGDRGFDQSDRVGRELPGATSGWVPTSGYHVSSGRRDTDETETATLKEV